MRKRNYWYLIVILTLAVVFAVFLNTPKQGVSAQSQTETPPIIVYIFWGDGCPHCASAKEYLGNLQIAFPQVEVRDYEVWYVQENQDLFIKMANAFNFTPRGVPTIMLGDYYWEGFSEGVQEQIEYVVRDCIENGCRDAGAGMIPENHPVEITRAATQTTETQPIDTPTPETVLAEQTTTPTTAPPPPPQDSRHDSKDMITLPIIGKIDLATQSLVLSTGIIAFVDGFNPCSMWVLSMLLALTLHTGSRRKITIIGLVFITVTALIYVLFIAGLFSLFTFISFLGWIQIVIAMLALFFAIINIKDYFWYKEGVSFTIKDEKKSGIFQNIRKVMDASQSLWGLAGATVIMAAGVSMVEFSCTAGFPVLWTNLLAAQGVSTSQFIFLLLIYMIIYQIDELAIFFIAVFTLKSSKLEEKHGRLLKLVGGMLMLTLAVVMIVKPGLMNSISSTLIIFGIAFGAAMLVLLVHRKLLPALGIKIGTEKEIQNRHGARPKLP